MDGDLRRLGLEAIERIDALLEAGQPLDHEGVRGAVACLVAFRNGALRRHRENGAARGCLEGANAALSLAYGAQFPLAGAHLHRLEQVRDVMRVLVDAAPGARYRQGSACEAGDEG
jgi:hypothetical protein